MTGWWSWPSGLGIAVAPITVRASWSRNCSTPWYVTVCPPRHLFGTIRWRPHRSPGRTDPEPGVAEKWDLYIRGVETATAYSELVDPVIQRERFVDQARFAGLGDAEAMPLDEDFLRAMEYGMPPSGGMGMGVDRLLMALTGLGIRETILFPFVRPD